MKPTIEFCYIAGILLCSCLLMSCSENPDKRSNAMTDCETLKSDMETVAHMRVYFGHQSVGRNILDGLKDLSSDAGATQLNIQSVQPGAIPAGRLFAESTIGQNGDPNSKCDSFARLIGSIPPDGSPDVALMKFCYVDFEEGTNVDSLFAYYRRTIQDLKAKFPQTTFVHVTAPLTTRTPGWKRFVKSILGRPDSSDIVAYKRLLFNEVIKREFGSDPIFDLAGLESTNDDGTRTDFDYQGNSGYSLRADFTDDGGHLNALGRRAAARELIRVMAKSKARL
jgi:hypothetical protein